MQPTAAPTPLGDDDLESMLSIRLFEQGLLRLFAQNKLSGTTHTCIGQEYVPVAVSALLQAADYVFSNHRGHGHYLARFRDPYGLLCEITGKKDGVCQGVGGSQHIYRDTYVSTGVQGESIPVACGVALSLKTRTPGAIALAYIGDGTWGEGSVYEGLNMASLWGLPVVVIVENNRIAQTTPLALNMAGTIRGRVEAFGIDYVHVVERDVNRVREILAPKFENVRRMNRPLVVEVDAIRLGPHSKGDDTRDPEELKANASNDWYAVYRAAYPAHFEKIEKTATAAMEEVFSRADACVLSDWEPEAR